MILGHSSPIGEHYNIISNRASKAREQESIMSELEQGQVEGDNHPVIQFPAIRDFGGQNVRMSEHCLNQQLTQILGRQVEKVEVPERRIWKEIKRRMGLNL